MYFIPFLLLALAAGFAIFASRHDMPLFKSFAWVLVIAAIGSCVVIFMALSVL